MIHQVVSITRTREAAREIIRVMEREGHAWLIKPVDDEGFEIVRADSPLAARWHRSGCPSIVGPYTADAQLRWLVDDLHVASRDRVKLSDARNAYFAKRKREKKALAILEAMPRTQSEAKLQQAVRYYPGKPCNSGHTTTHLTLTGECDTCRRNRMDRQQEYYARQVA